MKIKLTILFLLNYILVVHTQTILENTSFIIGGQLHEVNPLGLTQYPILSPEIGIAYTFKKIPVRLTYRRNFNYGSNANSNLQFNANYANTEAFSNLNETDKFSLYYLKNGKHFNYAVGVGYFHKKFITPGYFFTRGISGRGFGNDFQYQGISLSFLLKLKNLNIEFEKYVQLEPTFAALESYLYGISIYRNIHLKRSEKKSESSKKWDNFFVYVSGRTQIIKYHAQNKDLFNLIGFSFGGGVGYDFNKLDVTVILSRDVWKRIIGGTSTNDMIGYISTSNLMIRKYQELKNKRRIYYALGWHPIRNTNEPKRAKYRIVTDPATGIDHEVAREGVTNVFGIGASFGYEFNKNVDVEIRQIFPYRGDYFFNPYYLTLGLNYNMR